MTNQQIGIKFTAVPRLEKGEPVVDIMVTSVGGTSYSLIGIPAETAHQMAVELNNATLIGVSDLVRVNIAKRVGL